MTKYSTAELAKLLGVSKNTLLRWEEQKLIPEAERDGRGWRVWDKNHLLEILEHKKKFESNKVKTNNNLRVSIIGYGNQARVWAKNLKSSGHNVKILLRKDSPNFINVYKDGLEALELTQGLKEGSVFCLLIPDEEHENFFNKYNELLNNKKLFIFAHGYSVYYLKVKTPARKALLAPKAIASVIRERYFKNLPIPTAFNVEDKNDILVTKELSKALGFYPLIDATFKEETVSDLFTEQALLCSSLPFFMLKIYNKLTENKFNKRLAFEECLNELDYIIKTIKEHGIFEFYKKISPIAFKGAMDFFKVLENNEDLNKLLENTFDNIIEKKFTHLGFDKDLMLEKIKIISQDFDKTLKEEVL